MGADYIQYLITDQVASPLKYQHYYSEKFLYLPHSFLANSMAYMYPHIKPPTLRIPNKPQANGCGGPSASFVYCNFNKQLKFSPEVFRCNI